MAVEVRAFTATIPAGTPETAPVTIDMSFPARQVDLITVKVPPGSSGLMGFALQNSDVTVIPAGGSRWIVTDNELIQWSLTDQITSGSWQLIGYNTGAHDHSVYVRFALSLPPAAAAGITAGVLDAALLDNVSSAQEG